MPAPDNSLKEPDSRTRSAEILDDLRQRLADGTYPVGAKLPPERDLVLQYGSSRVVVREALAGLRAEGRIESRKGSGAYVLEERRQDIGAGMIRLNPQIHSEILECLELRLAIESEAAGIAARRCSPAQIENIADCLGEMKARIERKERVGEADFAFHEAVAEAANNRYFSKFLRSLGESAVPRTLDAKSELGGADIERENQFLQEHYAVFRAISAGDEDRARSEMRRHLGNALAHYRNVFAESREVI